MMNCSAVLLYCSIIITSFIHGEAFIFGTQTKVDGTHSACKTIQNAINSSDSETISQSKGGNSMAETDTMMFGRFKILSSQIFHKTKHSFAVVNLRPIVHGHVLVVSNRVAPTLTNLTDNEYDDLWKTVRKVQRVLKQKFNCDAFNVAVQDGTAAGQSVPHVHIHILPRYHGDFERNDDIYDELEMWAPRPRNSNDNNEKKRLEVPDDSERKDRTLDEMAEEASCYRALMIQDE